MPDMVQITGRVADTSSGLTVPGVQVEAWDDEGPSHQIAASAATDAGGGFTLQFDRLLESPMLGLPIIDIERPGGDQPDLPGPMRPVPAPVERPVYLKVLRDGAVLPASGDARWDGRPEVALMVDAGAPAAPPPPPGGPRSTGSAPELTITELGEALAVTAASIQQELAHYPTEKGRSCSTISTSSSPSASASTRSDSCACGWRARSSRSRPAGCACGSSRCSRRPAPARPPPPNRSSRSARSGPRSSSGCRRSACTRSATSCGSAATSPGRARSRRWVWRTRVRPRPRRGRRAPVGPAGRGRVARPGGHPRAEGVRGRRPRRARGAPPGPARPADEREGRRRLAGEHAPVRAAPPPERGGCSGVRVAPALRDRVAVT